MAIESRDPRVNVPTPGDGEFLAHHVGGGTFALLSEEQRQRMINSEFGDAFPDEGVLRLMQQTPYELSIEGTHEADVRQRDASANGLFGAGLLGVGSLLFVPGIGWGALAIAGAGYVGTRIAFGLYYRYEDAQYSKALAAQQLENVGIQEA